MTIFEVLYCLGRGVIETVIKVFYNPSCDKCKGSNGHCDECKFNRYYHSGTKNLYKRDWNKINYIFWE